MSTTTFVTAYTSRNSEVARTFHGVASDKTMLAWAKRLGAIGDVHVTVVDHKWRESHTRSLRILEH